MALFGTYSFSGSNQYLSDLKAFAEANGWTIDFFGTYNGNNRLHLHKGSSHFEVWYRDNLRVYLCGCTGYSSGAAPTAQPGTSAAISHLASYTGITEVYFASSGSSLYLGANRSGDYRWGGCLTITEKVGTWAGGIMVVGDDFNTPNDTYRFFFGPRADYMTLFINGVWTPLNGSAVANALYGMLYSDNAFTWTPPARHNLGILPTKCPLFVRNASNTGLVHPVGFAPGLRVASPGDVYDVHSTMTIDGASHVWCVRSGQSNFLIRLEV